MNAESVKSAYQVRLIEIFVLLIATALVMPSVSNFLRSVSREVFVQICITWVAFLMSFALCLFFHYRGRKKAEVQAGKLIWAISLRQRFVLHQIFLHQIFGAFFVIYLSTSGTYQAATLASKVAALNSKAFPVWSFRVVAAHFFAALLGYCIASQFRFSFGGFLLKEFRENGTLIGDLFTSWKHYREIEHRTIANKTQLHFATKARRVSFGITGRVRYFRASHWKLDLPPNLHNEADRIVQSLNDARIRSIT